MQKTEVLRWEGHQVNGRDEHDDLNEREENAAADDERDHHFVDRHHQCGSRYRIINLTITAGPRLTEPCHFMRDRVEHHADDREREDHEL